MPNATVRANARPMPNAKPAENPDAELIALAQECAACGADETAAFAAVDAAEGMTRRIAPPKAVLRTEEDLQLGLFAGRVGIGEPYDREDVALIRPLARRLGRESGSEADHKLWRRACEILECWRSWSEAVAQEEAHTGYKAAQDAQSAALEQYDEVAKKLATVPAVTIEGLLAKARAYQHRIRPDDGLAEEVADDLKRYGPDPGVLALSLARDALRLASMTEA